MNKFALLWKQSYKLHVKIIILFIHPDINVCFSKLKFHNDLIYYFNDLFSYLFLLEFHLTIANSILTKQ